MATMAGGDALQLMNLPSDVLLHVFKFLPGFDALSMGATCKAAHSLVNTVPLWITMIEDRFGKVHGLCYTNFNDQAQRLTIDLLPQFPVQGILEGRAYTTVSDLKELYFIFSSPRQPAGDMRIAWGREQRYWQHRNIPGRYACAPHLASWNLLRHFLIPSTISLPLQRVFTVCDLTVRLLVRCHGGFSRCPSG